MIKKGSLLAILFCANDEGRKFVTLFTDSSEIKAWTDERVSTLVMPAQQAWQFVTSQPMYDGAVINPANLSLELNRRQIELLQQVHGGTSNDDGLLASTEQAVLHNDVLLDLLCRAKRSNRCRFAPELQRTRCQRDR